MTPSPAILLAFLPETVQACAVCFGKTDNQGLVQGLTWGIAILIGATFFILTGIVRMVLKIEKQREIDLEALDRAEAAKTSA